jgi:hypothetical protein
MGRHGQAGHGQTEHEQTEHVLLQHELLRHENLSLLPWNGDMGGPHDVAIGSRAPELQGPRLPTTTLPSVSIDG